MSQELDKINNRTNTTTTLFHRHKKLDNCVICYYEIWKLGISDKKRPKMGLFFSYMPKKRPETACIPFIYTGNEPLKSLE